MDTPVLRTAHVEDINAINELYMCLHDHHIPSHEFIAAAIQSPNHYLIVVEKEGIGIVGSVCMTEMIEPSGVREGYINSLIIHPSQRRFGYGALLFNALEEEAKRRGCQRMIFTSGAWRKEALQFHKARGYRIRAHALYEGDTNFFEKDL